MDITKIVGQAANCSIPTETNAEGANVAIVVANILWSIDDTTVGTLTSNPDGSASVLGIKTGVVTVTVKDTAFNLTKSGTVTFTEDATPVSIDFTIS